VNNDDCDRTAALAPALPLGALDPEENAFVRAHLASCSRPHPELRESLALAAVLGSAMPDEDLPSPALRQRLLDSVRADARPEGSPASAHGRPSGVRPFWRWSSLGAASLALAASVALAVQVGQAEMLREQLSSTEGRLIAAAAELNRAQAWIERAVARGADAYFMTGEGQAEQASFMLVVEPDASGAVLLMSGLPQLPAEETYELWVERDGQVVAVETFRPDGGGLAAVTIDASLAGIRQAMVTVEPMGGSDAPSAGEVVMQGDLTL
jgi:hypothetical protein